MKKTLILAAFALAALPAMAATTTVEFAPAEGDKLVAVFSDDGTVSFNGGEPVAYTSDEAGKTICSSVNGTDNCATFETWGTTVGHVTPYTTSQGSSGVATVTAATE
jgi:hypothetical protein